MKDQPEHRRAWFRKLNEGNKYSQKYLNFGYTTTEVNDGEKSPSSLFVKSYSSEEQHVKVVSKTITFTFVLFTRFIEAELHTFPDIVSVNKVASIAEWYRYRIVNCPVTSSSPVPLKTRRVGQRCTLNLLRAEASSSWCGVVVRRVVPAQVSSKSLDHGSKLRRPSPKALV
ncbi:uncharacterized protein TNCV_866821 [Trichonephila clavipes]|nr:uncharacterized protein TNCV_866821 [Trichonephila clavipes]